MSGQIRESSLTFQTASPAVAELRLGTEVRPDQPVLDRLFSLALAQIHVVPPQICCLSQNLKSSWRDAEDERAITTIRPQLPTSSPQNRSVSLLCKPASASGKVPFVVALVSRLCHTANTCAVVLARACRDASGARRCLFHATGRPGQCHLHAWLRRRSILQNLTD